MLNEEITEDLTLIFLKIHVLNKLELDIGNLTIG